MREFLPRVSALGKKVVITAPLPRFLHHVPLNYMRIAQFKEGVDLFSVRCTEEMYTKDCGELVEVMKRLEREGLCTVIYPHDALQPGEEFQYVRDGVLMLYDKIHMTSDGSIWLWSRLKPQLKEIFSGEGER